MASILSTAFLFVALAIDCTLSAEGDLISSADFAFGNTQGWTLAGSLGGLSAQGLTLDSDRLAVAEVDSQSDKVWYFAAPAPFMGGDKAALYNGWLSFELGHYEFDTKGSVPIDDYDVVLVHVLKNRNIGLKGLFYVDGVNAGRTYNVRLEESFRPSNGTSTTPGWLRLRDRAAASQSDFQDILLNIRSIWLRGGYFRGREATWLRRVTLQQGRTDKGGMRPVPQQSNSVDTGETSSVKAGLTSFSLRSQPPAPSSTCCASRSCVSNDKFEILFDRPGCITSTLLTCVGNEVSTAPGLVLQGQALTEGRQFVWGQNMGMQAAPISKPFSKFFFFNSLPRICSSASLTVAVHGDLKYAGDNVEVYGEGWEYLGTLFAGQLTYENGDPSVSQMSSTSPYVDSVVIPQNLMMRYAADGVLRLAFVSTRGASTTYRASGTDSTLFTPDCNVGGGCSLANAVIFRSLKLTFNAAACYVGTISSSTQYTSPLNPVNNLVSQTLPSLNISFSFPTPSGTAALAGDDGFLSVVTDGDVLQRYNFLTAFAEDGKNAFNSSAVGRLFDQEEWLGRGRDATSLTGWGGTTPLTPTYTDAALIPRATIDVIAADGAAKLWVVSAPPVSGLTSGRFSPVTLTYPLLNCFMRTISTGDAFMRNLERPSNLYFDEAGLPLPGADVSMTLVLTWQNHMRYGTQLGGNNAETPLLRFDATEASSRR